MAPAAVRAVHPFPSVLVAGLTVALVPLADPEAPASLYVRLGVAMLAFQFAIGLVNDLVDIEDDRREKPWKPLARGALSVGAARAMAVAFAVGGLLVSATLPIAALVVAALGLASGLAYDLWLKRTTLSWLPYSIALPLVPVWVHLAAEAWQPLLWWAFPLGAALGFALHLANEVPDVGRPDVEGLPGRLGPRSSRRLALLVFAACAVAVALLISPDSPRRALLVALVGLGVTASTPFASSLGRDGLFGLLAAGSAVLAVLFFLEV